MAAKGKERALVDKIASAVHDPTFNYTLFADIVAQTHWETQRKIWKILASLLAAWTEDYISGIGHSPREIQTEAEHLNSSLIAYRIHNHLSLED